MAKSFLIALPVRNGGHHLRQCVASILAQSHREFELVVLDNASTDGTLQWLNQQTDSRISVIASGESLGIEASWARIARLPVRHEFMTLVGHDDLLDERFLQIMCGLIDEQPDAGLYNAHFRLIDTNGHTIRPCIPMPAIERPSGFLSSRLRFQRDSFGTGYVFRSADYVRVGGIPAYRKLLCADDALWMMLMKDSFKATTSARCFSYRVHSGSTSFAPDWRASYEGLRSYLDYLEARAAGDGGISAVLRADLPRYMQYWYRWAFLAVKDEKGRDEVTSQVEALVRRVAPLVGHEPDADLGSVFSDLQGTGVRRRYFLWRARKALKTRLWAFRLWPLQQVP
jgi:glycosyltransferase involved in cell wall biosynthesis